MAKTGPSVEEAALQIVTVKRAKKLKTPAGSFGFQIRLGLWDGLNVMPAVVASHIADFDFYELGTYLRVRKYVPIGFCIGNKKTNPSNETQVSLLILDARVVGAAELPNCDLPGVVGGLG